VTPGAEAPSSAQNEARASGGNAGRARGATGNNSALTPGSNERTDQVAPRVGVPVYPGGAWTGGETKDGGCPEPVDGIRCGYTSDFGDLEDEEWTAKRLRQPRPRRQDTSRSQGPHSGRVEP
jgi:hypothetical protein